MEGSAGFWRLGWEARERELQGVPAFARALTREARAGGWMDGERHPWMGGWMHGWMERGIHGWVHAWISLRLLRIDEQEHQMRHHKHVYMHIFMHAFWQVYEQEHQRMRQNWIDAKNRLEAGEGMMHLPSSDLDDPMRPEKAS